MTGPTEMGLVTARGRSIDATSGTSFLSFVLFLIEPPASQSLAFCGAVPQYTLALPHPSLLDSPFRSPSASHPVYCKCFIATLFSYPLAYARASESWLHPIVSRRPVPQPIPSLAPFSFPSAPTQSFRFHPGNGCRAPLMSRSPALSLLSCLRFDPPAPSLIPSAALAHALQYGQRRPFPIGQDVHKSRTIPGFQSHSQLAALRVSEALSL
ncbi:hypothetical protein C8R43DRAFT_169619 [Mycena crocata]|nr:hypothetical protein C8R43DRAFT_169619 [Mycena crocata]